LGVEVIARLAIIVGAIAGALGVAASARASHGGLESLMIAAQFLLFHAPVLLSLAVLVRVSLVGPRAGGLVLALFLLGLTLFSGDLAMRALAGQPLFRMAAPLGGGMLILAWIALAASAFTGEKNRGG
jgi:uncharacterized membrane protein YgdD (TMEM256/DUF423 family)